MAQLWTTNSNNNTSAALDNRNNAFGVEPILQ